MDISGTQLRSRGETFTLAEGQQTHTFEWPEFSRIKEDNLQIVTALLKKQLELS